MKNQVLSIEQMKHLQEFGVDTSKASCYWYFDDREDYLFWGQCTTPSGVPTFTLKDMLEMLPPHFYSFPFEDKERYVIHDMVMERLTGEWLIGYTHGIEKGKTLFYFQGDLLTCAYEILCRLAENNYIGGEK